jgi:hypothetical protein
LGRIVGGEADFVNGRPSALSVIALLAVVALGHVMLFPRVGDLDGFYHIGHALAYLEGSILDPSLPWATYSIIGDYGADLWWGFHVLLLPFAALGDVAVGLRLAAVALTLGLGFTVFVVLRRHGVPLAGVWAALFLVAVPNIFFRHLMVRPHVVSLAASIALLSVLVRGRWWQVALLSALIAWVHLSLFWIAPSLAVAYAIARVVATVTVGRERPDTGVPIRLALPAAVLGTVAGWLMRPEPLATASLLNVQLVQLFVLKATDAPLTFSQELAPIGFLELVRTTWLFAAAWLGVIVVTAYEAARGRLARLGQSRATLMVAGLLVSTTFLALALMSARRAMEQWVSFGFLSIALLAGLSSRTPSSEALPPPDVTTPTALRRVVRTGGAVVVVVYLAWGAWRHSLNARLVASPADSLREAAEFLESASEPGDLVFHARWDNFGPLFAYNRTNRYLGGMDPIFQFAHDARSYWEFFYLSADVTTEWTCDAYPCTEGVATDTHQALTDHFGARWVLVEPRRNPRLSLYLLNDPRFELALETQREAVFEIVPRTVVDQDRP